MFGDIYVNILPFSNVSSSNLPQGVFAEDFQSGASIEKPTISERVVPSAVPEQSEDITPSVVKENVGGNVDSTKKPKRKRSPRKPRRRSNRYKTRVDYSETKWGKISDLV